MSDIPVPEVGSLPHITLSFFLWLPAGKDEFGFDKFDDAPLSDTAYYRSLGRLERTISSHFVDKSIALRGDNGLAFMEPGGPRTPDDGELGLRKIHFDFTYNPNFAELRNYARDEPIPGTAVFLSNGLYLWSFRVPLKRVLKPDERERLKGVLKDFLIHDFVDRHIRHLFHFGWNPGTAGSEPDDYRGILTYYQLDLLFNGVFDQFAHPHLSLGEQAVSAKAVTGAVSREAGARKSYNVQYLVESLCLFAVDNDYLPLFDQRKVYSLRRTHGDTAAYVDSEANLSERHLPADNEAALHKRELLLSRVSFAAMEQFLRVAVSFGLSHYKTGLDHIRSELISQGIEARKNRPSGDLRRPSLRGRGLTLADIEAYYALLAGKTPVLSFLRDLVDGLSEVSRPSKEVSENGVEGAVEWRFSQDTLNEARTQFQRQVEAIKADVAAIELSLTAVRNDLMLLELTEARKLQEIAAESPRAEVEIKGGTLEVKATHLEQKLTKLLALIALLIGIMEILSNVGVWLTDKLLTDLPPPFRLSQIPVVGFWIGAVALVAAVYGIGRRRMGLNGAGGDEPDPPTEDGHARRAKKVETHVFDYSSLLREVLIGDGRSAPVMERISREMIDIEDPTTMRTPCASFSTFHETPSSGLERIKYSLESQATTSGVVYILHVEFDHRLTGGGNERLLDIRLVVRKPASSPPFDLTANSRRAISECVQNLLFPDGNEGKMRPFFLERFGWEWPPSQA